MRSQRRGILQLVIGNGLTNLFLYKHLSLLNKMTLSIVPSIYTLSSFLSHRGREP